jgi:hypothetical protein
VEVEEITVEVDMIQEVVMTLVVEIMILVVDIMIQEGVIQDHNMMEEEVDIMSQ